MTGMTLLVRLLLLVILMSKQRMLMTFPFAILNSAVSIYAEANVEDVIK